MRPFSRHTGSKPHSLTLLLPSQTPPCLPRADLIVSNPVLLRIFEPLLRRADELGINAIRPPNIPAWEAAAHSVMHGLYSECKLNSVVLGVIVDEVQNITKAVVQESVAYFKTGWYDWQSKPSSAFVRMDIASSHGECRLATVRGCVKARAPVCPDPLPAILTPAPPFPTVLFFFCRAA